MMPADGTGLSEGIFASLHRLQANIVVRALALLAVAWIFQACASAAYAACTAAGSAAEVVAQPCLTTLVQTDIASGIYAFSALDLASAQANDAAYANLLKICGPAGRGCSGSQLQLFDRLRNLEDNAPNGSMRNGWLPWAVQPGLRPAITPTQWSPSFCHR
jgi:hypothetical protein